MHGEFSSVQDIPSVAHGKSMKFRVFPGTHRCGLIMHFYVICSWSGSRNGHPLRLNCLVYNKERSTFRPASLDGIREINKLMVW
jgi:hypothetical protein